MHEIFRYHKPLETPKEPPDENFPVGDKNLSTFFREIPLWLNKTFAPEKWAAPQISETPETSRDMKMVPSNFSLLWDKTFSTFFVIPSNGLPKPYARQMSTFDFDSLLACLVSVNKFPKRKSIQWSSFISPEFARVTHASSCKFVRLFSNTYMRCHRRQAAPT